MGKKKVVAKEKRKQKKPEKKDEEKEENKADFYLDDADADLAYNSSDLEESEHGSELDFDENEYVSSEEEEEEGKNENEEKKEKKMTKAELKKLIQKASSGVEMSLTKIIILFGKVTNPNTTFEADDENEDEKNKNVLSNQKVISKLIKFCIETLPDVLNKKLNDKNESVSLQYKKMIKRYISIIARYIKTCETTMKHFIFSKIDLISNMIFLFANFTEVFLKQAIQIWSTNPSNEIGQSCLSFIKTLIIQNPKFYEYAIKIFYINYLEIAKAMNYNSFSQIEKLQEDIISILKIDLQKAYLTIFTFIRKLCIQLRMTIIDKTSSSIKSIYNWQFVNSLILWARVIIAYADNEDIALLDYPLIQTIIGVIRLNYSESFYLLRIRLAMILNAISKASNIYIPTAMYILPILKSNYFIEKCKVVKENSKKDKENKDNRGTNKEKSKINQRINVLINLKIKKEEYKLKQIRKDLLEECCDCIIEFLSINANRISFDEIAYGVLKEMRSALKGIYDKEYRMIIKSRMELIETNMKTLHETLLANNETVNLTNPESIHSFESNFLKQCEFAKEYDNIQHRRKANFEAIQHQKENTFIEV